MSNKAGGSVMLRFPADTRAGSRISILFLVLFLLTAAAGVRSRAIDFEEKVVYGGAIIALLVPLIFARLPWKQNGVLIPYLMVVLPLVGFLLIPAHREWIDVVGDVASNMAMAAGYFFRRDLAKLGEWLEQRAGRNFMTFSLFFFAVSLPIAATYSYMVRPFLDRPEAPSTVIFIILGMLAVASRWALLLGWGIVSAVTFANIAQRSSLLLLAVVPAVEFYSVLKRRRLGRILGAVIVMISGIVLFEILRTHGPGRWGLLRSGFDGSTLERVRELEELIAGLESHPIATFVGFGSGYMIIQWAKAQRNFVHFGYGDLVLNYGVFFGIFLGVLFTIGVAAVFLRTTSKPILYGTIAATANFLLYNHAAYFVDTVFVGALIGWGADALPRIRRVTSPAWHMRRWVSAAKPPT